MPDLTVEEAVKKLRDEGYFKEVPPRGVYNYFAGVRVVNDGEGAFLVMVIEAD